MPWTVLKLITGTLNYACKQTGSQRSCHISRKIWSYCWKPVKYPEEAFCAHWSFSLLGSLLLEGKVLVEVYENSGMSGLQNAIYLFNLSFYVLSFSGLVLRDWHRLYTKSYQLCNQNLHVVIEVVGSPPNDSWWLLSNELHEGSLIFTWSGSQAGSSWQHHL